MSFDLQRMLESKRAYRQKLAARPLVEKLRLLDELRARALVIRGAANGENPPGMVAEPLAEYRADPDARKESGSGYGKDGAGEGGERSRE